MQTAYAIRHPGARVAATATGLKWSLFFLALWIAAAVEARPSKNFRVFDTTLYSHKPDLRQHDVQPLEVVYGHLTYDKGQDQSKLPSRDRITTLAKKLARTNSMVVLDYERWPVQGYRNVPFLMDNSREHYRTLLHWFKEAAPEVKFGYFGIVPINNYLASIASVDSRLSVTWQEDNQNMRQLASEVDVVFVEAYAYTDNPRQWRAALEAHLAQLKAIYSGDIYLFIWPQYFDHAPAPEALRLRHIPKEFWRYQLETARELSNGAVIWGGWNFDDNKPQRWNPDAEWWLETKRFTKELNSRPAAPTGLTGSSP